MKRWFIVIFLAALFVSAPLAAATYKGEQSGPALCWMTPHLNALKQSHLGSRTAPRFNFTISTNVPAISTGTTGA